MSTPSKFLAVLFILVGLVPGLYAQEAPAPPDPVVLDCDTNEACREIAIQQDPIDDGCLPINGAALSDPCQIRGHFDPSLWQGDDGTLWLAYTHVSLVFPQPGDLEAIAPSYDTHLARSDDGGATWAYVAVITTGSAYDHPQYGPTVIAHEVPDLAQNPDGTWSLLWLQYTRPYDVTAFNDPVVARKDAPTPAALADAELQLHLSGWAESPWFPADFSPTLPSGLSNCLGMTEPSIFTADERTYVVVECLSVDISDPAFPIVPEEGTVELFEWLGHDYAHIGTLLTYPDAQALAGEGDAVSLAQPDVARAQNGDWLLLVTPNNQAQDPPFQGCRVLTIDDLSTASVRRNADGTPQLRASITATSQHLGAGQCTYNASSETGVMFGVGFDAGQGLRLHLVATGLHP